MSEVKCYHNESIKQCCCDCKYHLKDFHHCGTNDILQKHLNMCICDVPKGFICTVNGVAHSGWWEHSAGCEMYTKETK